VWPSAAVIAVLIALGIAVILSWALPGGPAVTNDPPLAESVSTAETLPPTNVLISDPFVRSTSTLDYMYSSGLTGVGKLHLPETTFVVMGKFHSFKDAVPILPPWVVPDTGLWSPDVRKVGKTYVMWFSARDNGFVLPTGVSAQCLGVATSASPTGPFAAHSSTPSVCQTSEAGDIDPRTFVAPNGQEWLYWKNDGNAADISTTHLYAQRLASNGTTLMGSPTVLLSNDLPWEGSLIEAPEMVRAGNRYLLFFTGNASVTPDSGIGLAFCKGPGGPCATPYAGPWLGSNAQGAGPGEETLYTQNGITWMLYTPHSLYYAFGLPRLAAARIAFTSDGMPYVANRQGMVPGVTAGRDGQVGLR
jgi:hypothetical protein